MALALHDLMTITWIPRLGAIPDSFTGTIFIYASSLDLGNVTHYSLSYNLAGPNVSYSSASTPSIDHKKNGIPVSAQPNGTLPPLSHSPAKGNTFLQENFTRINYMKH